MFAHAFVRNAYLAGTFIALACGGVGWLAVVRGQLFAGDALSHVAFVGALAAAALGLDIQVGLFVLTLLVAAAMAGLGGRARPDDAEIGTVFAWILGIGVLLIALLAQSSSGGNGIIAAQTLFGSIYTLSASAAQIAAGVGLAALAAMSIALRPLLLASLDAELALARGVPVRLLGTGFLLVLAVVTAATTQSVGALLLLGLMAAPAGAAHKLTDIPFRGFALSCGVALIAMWGGLALAYAIPSLPPSTTVIGLAAAAYVLTALWRSLHETTSH
jgi:zinc/manganese transport system permease protein